MPGIDSVENEFRWRVVEPSRYDDASFRHVKDKFGKGVGAIFGCPSGKYRGGKCSVGVEIQALRFDKETFKDKTQVRKWLDDHPDVGKKEEKVKVSYFDARNFPFLAKTMRAYSEDQPRDEGGKWTEGGDAGEGKAEINVGVAGGKSKRVTISDLKDAKSRALSSLGEKDQYGRRELIKDVHTLSTDGDYVVSAIRPETTKTVSPDGTPHWEETGKILFRLDDPSGRPIRGDDGKPQFLVY